MLDRQAQHFRVWGRDNSALPPGYRICWNAQPDSELRLGELELEAGLLKVKHSTPRMRGSSRAGCRFIRESQRRITYIDSAGAAHVEDVHTYVQGLFSQPNS